MTIARSRPFGQKYAFVVVAIAFVALLVGAGQRAAPGVLIVPLEQAFGWGRDVTSLSAAIGIFLYGLVGPFAAALMQSFGVRRTLLCALALMAAASGASAWMTEPWQLVLSWGVLSGVATGCVAVVFGATVINRWFVKHRGLMMGILTASTATGTLIFLPGMAALAEAGGWRPVVLAVSAVCLALLPLAWWLMPERPSDIGLVPYGAAPGHEATPSQSHANPLKAAFSALAMAVRSRNFWFLFATFFICGFTTNGLIGTHFIALCSDQGIPEVRAASLLAMMGLFDLFGTTASGWLTDRYDPRKLLCMYYGLRGASLIFLPFSDFSIYSLGVFAVFYGLDWIATVPPTLRLAVESFGERDAPIVFGWIVAGHQLGAASAAFMAGALRQAQGNYLTAFVISGATGIIAAVIALQIRQAKAARAVPAV
ncbi:MFS transporter [Bordetella genomosp. 9]|uniref:MFS transporter n=1 Tax=Bordetella genomosp. 9 TaxID=1416803 RepID=UPI000A292717|nr:MFS transporter [Bordetella genomosp. 9]ARP91144.1 MFS transporter [Bordetella genomosp. 9]